MSEKKLIYQIKPHYNLFIRFFSNNLSFTLGLLVLVSWFTMFGFVLINPNMSDEKGLEIYMQINVWTFIISLTLLLFIDKMNYLTTTYELYSNKINFYEGFINHKGIEINLKHISEVHYKQNFLQKFFNLGTIEFLTSAYNGQNNLSISFTDIQNSNEIYKKTKEVLLSNENIINNEAIIETKPKYNEDVCLFPFAIIKSILYLISLLLYLLGPIMILTPTIIFNNGEILENIFSIIIHYGFWIIVLLFSATLLTTLFIIKKNYQVTDYKVYSNRLEIIEGFINHRQALVKLENIKELLLSQTYFQKKAELGTITFITSAYNFKKIPCLLFNDITNSLAIYTKIKQIRENNKNT